MTSIARELIAAALRGELDERRARQLAELGPEVVTLALLAASQCIAELQRRPGGASLTTPSGMIPVYAKPNTSAPSASKRRKKPGAKVGHVGARRERPARIDRRVTHRLKGCPHCHGRLQRCHRSRTRIIEDLPVSIEPVVTEHTLHRDYCPKCKKHVEPVVVEAMPQAAIGHRLVSLTGWFHYGLGLTIDQIVDLLGQPIEQATYSTAARLLGWAYHFSNGLTFGVMYLAILNDPRRRHWAWGAVFALAGPVRVRVQWRTSLTRRTHSREKVP